MYHDIILVVYIMCNLLYAFMHADSKTISIHMVHSQQPWCHLQLSSLIHYFNCISAPLGFLYGRLVPGKNWRPSSLESRHTSFCSHQSSSIGHMYEAVTSEMVASNFPDQEQQKVDLRENVAYEFVQPKTSKFVVSA